MLPSDVMPTRNHARGAVRLVDVPVAEEPRDFGDVHAALYLNAQPRAPGAPNPPISLPDEHASASGSGIQEGRLGQRN
jgi:hypothetical protein